MEAAVRTLFDRYEALCAQGLAGEADPEALAALLDEDLCWVTPLGRVTDRATALRYPNKAFPLEAVEAWVHHREGEDEQLIVSRVRTGRGSVLRSSLWTRGPHGWRLSFRQDTPAPSVSP